ncbi:unnamed protein product [Ceutorhynchus assimilis]|uniref:Single domain-containing protein n=1 Tax=Ceutorhynchus assimilis TaxID=467358 RepID=A0A9N9QAF7_9CUCU|nr:unnamed protein product [Ceutorhynchus assimilis]
MFNVCYALVDENSRYSLQKLKIMKLQIITICLALFAMVLPIRGYCYSNVTGVMTNGQKKYILDKCMQAECRLDKSFLYLYTCLSGDETGQRTFFTSKKYPHCCNDRWRI